MRGGRRRFATILAVCCVPLLAQDSAITIRARGQEKDFVIRSASAPKTGGKVAFYDGAIPLGVAVPDEGGVATLARRLASGKHRIRAVAWRTGKDLGPAELLQVEPRPASSFEWVSYATGLNVRAVAVGDFDGSGRLAIAAAADNALVIIRDPQAIRGPNGAVTPMPSVANPLAVAAADLDGNGWTDVAVADASGHISIHLNQGGGRFTRLSSAAGARPSAMAVADFNGDGIPDLAVANEGSDDVSILAGSGDGTFQAAQPVRTGQSPRGLIVADVDGNGTTDLVTVNALSRDIRVHLGAGDGTFRLEAIAPAGEAPSALAAGDFNEDGRIDLAVLDSASGTVYTLLRDIGGNYRQRFSRTIEGATGLGTGDLNGDGHLDLFVIGGAGISIASGAGDGSFSEGPEGMRQSATGAAAIADIDGDGRLDIVAPLRSGELGGFRAAQCSGAARLVFTQGPANPTTPAIGTVVVQVQAANGQPLTACRQTVSVNVLQPNFNLVVGDLYPSARETHDADASGNVSFTTLNTQTFTGNGFVLEASANSGAGTITARTPEFTISTTVQTLRLVFLQQPANGTLNVDNPNAAHNVAVNVAVQNQNNQTVTTAQGNVTLRANGPENFLGGNSVQSLLNGVAMVGGSLRQPGTYTLTASASGVPDATSNSFVVSYSAPVLEFSTQPAAGTAGTPLVAFAVRVRGTDGNTDTTSSAQVTVNVSSGPGAPTADSTLTANAVSGIATFSNVKLNVAGSYRLTARATGIKEAASNAFAVNPGPPVRVTILRQPSQVVAGLPFGLTAQLLDGLGNVSNSTAGVSLAVAPGTLTSSVAAVAGVATFTNLTLSTTGTYTPSVSSGGLTPATGTPFPVVAPPPAVAATSLTVPAAAGTGTLLVTVLPATAWTASSNAANPWLSVTPANGTGSRLITFNYTANPLAIARTGTMTIAGQTVTVTQQSTSFTQSTVIAPMVVSGLNGPRSLGVNGQGAAYIADTGANAIRSLSASSGEAVALVLSGISFPLGVSVDSRGNAYIADTGSGSVKVWNAASPMAPPTVLVSGLKHPSSVAVDWKGDVYIADTLDNSIKLFSAGTQELTTVVAGLYEPSAVATDGLGNVYYAELGTTTASTGTVKKWDPVAQAATSIAQNLNEPHGIAVDGRGNVYIAEAGAGRVRMWNAATQALTDLVVGMTSPVGMAADAVGTVYIADAADVSQRPASDTLGVGSVRAAFAAGTAAFSKASTAGTGAFEVSSANGAEASIAAGATSNASWLRLTSTANVVTYTLDANTTGANRTAIITVGGQQIRVTQSGTAAAPKTISVKFVAAGTEMTPSETAGAVAKANWNNAVGAATGLPMPLRDEDGAFTGVSIVWKATGAVAAPIADTPGNYRLMRASLDNPDAAPIPIRVTGLPAWPNGYDVYIYSDGDNGGERREVSFAIDDGLPEFCSDPWVSNFTGTLKRCSDGPGNYALLSTASTTFTITATPISRTQGQYRAPVNGIQIVARTAPIPPAAARTPGRAIGIKFAGLGMPMAKADTAGVVQQKFWNNAGKAVSEKPLKLFDADGNLTNATVEWQGNNPWRVQVADALTAPSGNLRLMNGYLDNGTAQPITVQINGLDPRAAGYDVYLYTDGDNGVAAYSGRYTMNSAARVCTDGSNVNFTGTFVPCNFGPGNYAQWPLPGSTSVVITATPEPGSVRSPINAIQIVPR